MRRFAAAPAVALAAVLAVGLATPVIAQTRPASAQAPQLMLSAGNPRACLWAASASRLAFAAA